MVTGWDALKAAWRGAVSGADLAAMFTATAGLTRLHEALEDRRLEAQIAQSPSGQTGQAGAEWRVALALGRIAAPLWLADALVALAGAFYDAEAQPRADRPASVSPSIHDLVASLLLPVEDIVADVTAALADPGRRATLTVPLRVGPGGDIADTTSTLPRAPGAAYVRELATGARRVHTSAAAALATLRAAFASSPHPTWLEAGLRRLDGDLQAAGARLDMAEVRVGAEAGTGMREEEPGAREALCGDLWRIIGVAVVAGQLIADPHLMPEAATAAQSGPSLQTHMPQMPPAPSASPAPAAEAEQVTAALPLPWVDAGAAPLVRRRDTPTPVPLAPNVDAVLLPQIEEGAASPREPRATPLPARHPPDPRPPTTDVPTISLPLIGEATASAPVEPASSQSTKPTHQAPQSHTSPKPADAHDVQNEGTPVPLPEIE